MKRPAIIPIICFLAGILISGCLKGGLPAWPWGFSFAALALTAAALCTRNERLFTVLMCLFFFLLGAFRYTSHIAPRGDDISAFISEVPQEAVIHGSVEDLPEEKGSYFSRHFVFTLKTGRAVIGGRDRSASGRARVYLYSRKNIPEVGDRIVIGGKISRPARNKNPAGMDSFRALARAGIHSILTSGENDVYLAEGAEGGVIAAVRRFLLKVRKDTDKTLDRYLRGEARSVIGAVTLGSRSGLAARTKDVFVKTGTAHVLAVSGLHVGIVAAVVIAFFRRLYFPKWAYYALAVFFVCVYAVFTGAQASSLRAALMFSFAFLAFMLQRRPDAVNGLALSAFCITFFCPSQIFEAGFIMSFTAVASLILFVPAIDVILDNVKKKKDRQRTFLTRFGAYLKGALAVSLAAWLGMAPVIAAYFNIITPSAVIANFIAIPALFAQVVSGLALCVFGPFALLRPLATIASFLARTSVSGPVAVMGAISRLPAGFIRVPPLGTAFVCVYYAALAVLAALFFRKKARARTILVFALLAAGLFIWNEALIMPPRAVRVTFFDVKKADATLIETPDGGAVLVDGGRGGREEGRDDGRYVVAPYLWKKGIRRLDCVVLTHSHEDHIGGLFYILENFRVGTVIIDAAPPGEEEGKELHEKFLDLLNEKKIRYVNAGRGDVIEHMGGLRLVFFNPPKEGYGNENDDSLVFKITTTAGNSILFCGDATSRALGDIDPGRAGMIKVPHHGSGLGDMAVVEIFMSRAFPVYVVIPAKTRGEVNARLLNIFAELGSRVLITGVSGAIVAEETSSGWKYAVCKPAYICSLPIRLTPKQLHTFH